MFKKLVASFSNSKSANESPKPQKKKDDLDLCLDKIAQHIRLDSKYREKVYGAILRRSTTILVNGGRDKEFLQKVYNQLERMLKKRRGLTIPVGIDAQNTQHYREISTVVLVLLYLVKLVSKENIGCAVQVDHEGSVYSYPVYQDYIYTKFRRVGIIRDRDSLTLTSDVEVSLRVAIFTDLLMNSPLTMQWFGMFPDMQRLLYRSLQNVDETIFTQISEEFVSLVYEFNSETVQNVQPIKVAEPKLNATQEQRTLTQKDQSAPKPLERKPLKATAGITSMLGQLQEKDKRVFNENSSPVNNELKPASESASQELTQKNPPPKSVMPISAAMLALAKKSQENKQSDIDEDQIIDLFEVGIDCIRTALGKRNVIDLALLVTKDGEIAYEKCLILPSEVWRTIAKERLQALPKKISLTSLEKELITKEVLIKSNTGLSVLNTDGSISTVLDVKKLSTEIQDEIELMDFETKTIEVGEISVTMVK
jgi:hypothetical protein